MTRPVIPPHLAHLPAVGGLAVPYITGQRPHDGAYIFGSIYRARQLECLALRLCGICGRPLADTMVFLVRSHEVLTVPDLETFEVRVISRTAEPAVHSECADYAAAACPMLAGSMSHYRSSPVLLEAGAEHTPDTAARLGHEAEQWYAVSASGYRVEIDWERRLPYAVVNELGQPPVPLVRKVGSK
jgi:hypothetical protein